MRFKDNLKAFVSYLKAFPTPTFLEAHSTLQTSCVELKGCIRELERENETLRQRLHLKGAFSRHNGAYFFETPDGQKEPFCSWCWEVKSKLVRLHLEDEGRAACPQCKNPGALIPSSRPIKSKG
jgi:hypothetical protein